MALTRRSGARLQANIWPGFVDAMTGLLMVLMFVLTIFMIVQFTLQETITGQESELDELTSDLAALSQALGLERDRSARLTEEVGTLTATLDDRDARLDQQAALIASLTQERDSAEASLEAAEGRITEFEAQVAGLLAQQTEARGQIADLQAEQERLIGEQESLQLALAQARDEIDAGEEAARLAAARREALEALAESLRSERDDARTLAGSLSDELDEAQAQLSEEEAARLAEAEAARALRERLENAQDELTAMTLALEEQRRQAEETLTLLAAAEAAQEDLDLRLAAALLARDEAQAQAGAAEGALTALRDELETTRSALEAERGDSDEAALRARLAAALAAQEKAETEVAAAETDREALRDQLAAALARQLAAEQRAEEQLSEAEQRAALLAESNAALEAEETKSAESQRRAAVLNQQVAALRTQLGSLQALLDDYKAREAASQVQLESLGQDLNAALARATALERRERQRAEAEAERLAEEARRLAEEAENLEQYRSDFFGRMRQILAGRDGVRIVGDRFVFSSEVLFAPARAQLSDAGRAQIAEIADILRQVSDEIPAGINWIIRVDGHTDKVPLRGSREFADNWELSQARALSVVRYMIELGIAPEHLSANGFGEYQPIAEGDSPEALAANRRIELKLTER